MLSRTVAALVLCVAVAAAWEFPYWKIQRRAWAPDNPPLPECEDEVRRCNSDPTCDACLQGETESPVPQNPTSCDQLKTWYDSVTFKDPNCNYRSPGNLLSDVFYCRLDTFAARAGLDCREGRTESPTAAPTVAPTAAAVPPPDFVGNGI